MQLFKDKDTVEKLVSLRQDPRFGAFVNALEDYKNLLLQKAMCCSDPNEAFCFTSRASAVNDILISVGNLK